MDERRRRAYLAAMGVTLWERRAPEPPAEPEIQDSGEAREPSERLEEAPVRMVEAREPPVEPAVQEAVSEPEHAAPPQAASEVPWDAEAPPPWSEDDLAGLDAGSELDLELDAEERGSGVADMDWDALRAAVADCQACGLCETRTQTVFGVGNPDAELMIVGEAPGADEDRAGEPFVGRAGQLLTRMLAAIGLPREQVFIANVLKCRPPGNRDPKPEEAMQCEAFLLRQMELVRPRIILSVGRISAQHLLRTDTSVGRLRGRWLDFGSRAVPLRVTYHPAYLLRSPDQKAKAWEDLTEVRRRLDALRAAEPDRGRLPRGG